MKLCFLGAGSTIFARNVIGDCMCADALKGKVRFDYIKNFGDYLPEYK